jgi:hypothetical protein
MDSKRCGASVGVRICATLRVRAGAGSRLSPTPAAGCPHACQKSSGGCAAGTAAGETGEAGEAGEAGEVGEVGEACSGAATAASPSTSSSNLGIRCCSSHETMYAPLVDCRVSDPSGQPGSVGASALKGVGAESVIQFGSGDTVAIQPKADLSFFAGTSAHPASASAGAAGVGAAGAAAATAEAVTAAAAAATTAAASASARANLASSTSACSGLRPRLSKKARTWRGSRSARGWSVVRIHACTASAPASLIERARPIGATQR